MFRDAAQRLAPSRAGLPARAAAPGGLGHEAALRWAGEAGAPADELTRMRHLRERVEALMSQPGVVFGGMLNQTSLAAAYAEAGFWLYPTRCAPWQWAGKGKAQVSAAAAASSVVR